MSSKPSSGPGCGMIQNQSGDKHEYLGHFRGASVLKKGHNDGNPSLEGAGGFPAPTPPVTEGGGGFATPAVAAGTVKPQYNALTNPILAAKQQNKSAIQSAKAAGTNAQSVRAENLARLTGAKTMRKERNAEGFKGSDKLAAKTARTVSRVENNAPGQAKHMAVQSAKADLHNAVRDVRKSRQAIRTSIRGGDVRGVGADFDALKASKAARGAAKAGVKSARQGGSGSRPTLMS